MQLPGEFSPFIEKKVVFCLVVGGVTPLPPLSGPTTKKNTFFMCVFPKEVKNLLICSMYVYALLRGGGVIKKLFFLADMALTPTPQPL